MAKKKYNRFGVLVTTALIIGCAMAGYYYYINKVKTQKVNKQAYHLLNRKAKDIIQLEEADLNMARTKFEEFIALYNDRLKDQKQELKALFNAMQDDENYGLLTKPPLTKETIIYSKDSVQFVIARDTSFAIYYRIPISDFIKNLNFSNTLYKNYALVADRKLHYTHQSDFSLAFNTLENHSLDALQTDTLVTHAYVLNSLEQQMEVNIKGVSYQAFIIPIDKNNATGVEYLMGFIETGDYNMMRQGLNYQLTVAIVIFVLVLLLSIPLIKLLVVSPGESYDKYNLVIMFINMCMICFFALFLIIKTVKQSDLNHQILHAHSGSDQGQLQELNLKIQSSFNEELDSLVSQLYQLKKHGIRFEYNRTNAQIPNGFWPRSDFSSYPYLESYFEMNKNGIITKILSTSDPIPSGIDVSKRTYFKEPAAFTIHKNQAFGFQSIFDLYSGIPEVVVSTIGKEHTILAISAHLYSITKTVLPVGYGYAIIDKSGKVWFHNESFNNVRENFLNEVKDKDRLLEAMQSRRNKSLITEYKLTPYYMYIQPLRPELDFYVITMCSKKMYDKNGSFLVSMVIGSYLGFGFMMIILVWLGIGLYHFIFKHRRMLGKSTGEWLNVFLLFPTHTKLKNYIVTIISNIIPLLVVAPFIVYGQIKILDFTSLFILLLISALSSLYWFAIQVANISDHQSQHYMRYSLKKLASILFFTLIPFLLSLLDMDHSFFTPKEQTILWLYPLCLNVMLSISYYVGRLLLNVLHSRLKHLSSIIKLYWQKIYASALFALVIWLVAIPLFTFFLYFHYYESLIFTNRQLYNIATQFETRQSQLWPKYFNTEDVIYQTRLSKGIYIPNDYQFSESFIKPLQDKTRLQQYVQQFGTARNYHHQLRDKIEFGITNINVNYISTTDHQYQFFVDFPTKGCFKNASKRNCDADEVFIALNQKNEKLYKIQKPLTFTQKTVYPGFPLAFLLVYMLFIATHQTLFKHIFPAFKYNSNIIRSYRNLSTISSKTPKRIYYITTTDNGYLQKRFTKELGASWQIVPLHKISDNHVEQATPLLITIPYFISLSPVEMQTTLQFLEQIFRNKTRKIYFASLIRPEDILHHFQQTLHGKDAAALISAMSEIFLQCRVFYLPLHNQWKGANYYLNARKQTELTDSIQLAMQQEQIYDNTMDKEYVSYAISVSYFHQIWNSCTSIEKSVLYDIAIDHIINLHNKREIGILINKGIVLNGAYLSLFHDAFRRFVLKQYEEIHAINDQLKEEYQGGWSIVRIPVIIIALAIILFIVGTQQHFLNNMQSILISVGTILTFGLRFIQIPWGKPKKKEEEEEA